MKSRLLTFDEVLEAVDGDTAKPNLLLANGFSCAAYPGFRYASLFDVALSNGMPSKAVELFTRYGTTNFEAIMKLLEDSDWVARQYGLLGQKSESPLLDDLRDVKLSLIKSISQTHPAHAFILTPDQKASCRSFLDSFHDIFTLNYDLLLYWVANDTRTLIDGFGFPSNESDNPPYLVQTQPRDYRPWLFHLHGALHLYTVEEETRKYRFQYEKRPLIEVICDGIQQAKYPLFVAEGSASQKLRHIRSNMYLSQCFYQFSTSSSSLVCYGMSFSESDNHIGDAIAGNDRIQRMFVGLHGDPDSESNLKTRASVRRIQERRSSLSRSRAKLEVEFFDSESAAVWS